MSGKRSSKKQKGIDSSPARAGVMASRTLGIQSFQEHLRLPLQTCLTVAAFDNVQIQAVYLV